MVQAFVSSGHVTGVPVQVPFEHVSPVVQTLLSLHAAPDAGVCVQPLAGLHESAVHGLPSSQFAGVPPRHAPLWQVSAVVQGLPSSHAPPEEGVLLQEPVAGLQLSEVHGLPSLQFFGVPLHAPPEQRSAVVHGLPSSQAFELLAW